MTPASPFAASKSEPAFRERLAMESEDTRARTEGTERTEFTTKERRERRRTKGLFFRQRRTNLYPGFKTYFPAAEPGRDCSTIVTTSFAQRGRVRKRLLEQMGTSSRLSRQRRITLQVAEN